MITVHHLENSRSQRILWLLEALNLEYKVIKYKRDPKTSLAPESLLKVNPLGKSPVLEDGGDILPESGAIVEYLLTKYDKDYKLHPASDASEYKDYLFWLHFAEGSLMWPLVMRLMHGKVVEKAPIILSSVAKLIFLGIEKAYLAHTIKNAFDYVEGTLTRNDFLLGSQLSAADIMMSFPLEAACAGRADMNHYPHIVSFVKRIHEDPHYQKAIEVGGPYAY